MEVAEGAFRVRSEDPVHAATVEPETGQCSLQVDHIIPAKVRSGQMEESLTQAPSGLDQGRPCRSITDARDAQVPGALELADGFLGRRPETAELDVRDRESEGGESALQIADRLSGGPGGQWEPLRNSSNSCSRALLLFAPTIRRRISPPEKSSIVGMLIT